MALNRLTKVVTTALIILGFVAAPGSFAATNKPLTSSGSYTPSWNQKHSGKSKSLQAQNPPLSHNRGSGSS